MAEVADEKERGREGSEERKGSAGWTSERDTQERTGS